MHGMIIFIYPSASFILFFDPHRVVSDGYYYPTLHQYKIELEDTLTSLNDQPAYFRYDESEFPGFSWRGYAVFSQAQVKNLVSVKHRVALIETH